MIERIHEDYVVLYQLKSEATNIAELSVGGSNAKRIINDMTIADMRVRTPNAAYAIVVQTGTYAPTDLRYAGKFLGSAYAAISVDTYA